MNMKTDMKKVLILAAGLALTVPAAILVSAYGKWGAAVTEYKSTGDIPETVESLDRLDCIYFESSSYQDGNAWVTFDFSAYTASIQTMNYDAPDWEQSVVPFTEEQAQAFLRTANDYGLFTWDDHYISDAEDGSWDRLEVRFADGSVKILFCRNAYPPDFDEVRDALFGLLDAGAEIRKTVDSLDMLRCIRYEAGDNLFGYEISMTFDFSAHTVIDEDNESMRRTANSRKNRRNRFCRPQTTAISSAGTSIIMRMSRTAAGTA